MTPAESRALGRLGGHVFAGLVARIGQVHQVIADRAFTSVGPTGAAARLVHDGVARVTYLAVRGAGTAAGAAAGKAAGKAASVVGAGGQQVPRHTAGGQQVPRHTAGDLMLAALNAAAGDQLGPDLAALVISMAVRVDRRDVELTASEIAAAFPDAASRMAVFVHGLAETENSWRRGNDRCAPYGDRLREAFGYTPVFVRYNTGRHISDNGRDLASLLDQLAAAWPARVDEIMLVGHSMGGLVIRSACHYGQQSGAAWAGRVRHVFYLGSPHLGAPLARAAGIAAWALGKVPEIRPFATLAAGSSSVKDLRHGYLLDVDWADCDQDRCLADHRSSTPLLATAHHHTISATVTADPRSPLGAVAGDLLVQPASAHGRHGPHQRIPFLEELGRGLGGIHHFDLLNHPDVWEAIRVRLHPAEGLRAASG